MTATPLTLINNSRRQQRGDFLLEAMVGLLLMVIMVMGGLYMTSKAMTAKREMRMQEVAIDQMHASLLSHRQAGLDLCTTPPAVTLPDGTQLTVTVLGCGQTKKFEVNGVEVAGVPVPLSLTLDSPLLGGLVRVGGSW